MLRDYQQKAHDCSIDWIKKSVEPCVIEAATGCHKKGFLILMANGSTKKVEDVEVNDKIMGVDGEERTVLNLHRGNGEMFKITPINGEPFTVNGGHILNLYKTKRSKKHSNEFVNISVNDFLKQSKFYKHLHKLHRSKIDFNASYVPIDAWALGFIVGDGCLGGKLTPSFTLCDLDKELLDLLKLKLSGFDISLNKINRKIKSGCESYSIAGNNTSRSSRNQVKVELEKLELATTSEFKKIPELYKFNSEKIRNDFLSGLLDSDGHYNKSCFDWISKSEQLADDVVFLARSLGLKAQKKQCIKSCQNNFSGTYYRVCISGNLEILNIQSKRRKPAIRKQIKNPLVTGFNIEFAGNGDYYGFTLDGDHLYLAHDFIVHHNSGKSHVIAEISKTYYSMTGKHVLCTAPSVDLILQNAEKYELTGNHASIFSASIDKCLKNPVVFGTPGTIKNKIDEFSDHFGLVILDECHAITQTIKDIINALRLKNKYLRVIGLTATPYRMFSGLIYAMDEFNRASGAESCFNPYFKKKIFTITAPELIEQGYLTPIKIGSIDEDHYNTANLKLNKLHKFDSGDIERAIVGQGRKTSKIIADIVKQSAGRLGVMIFASTVQHAKECLASLPAGNSAMIGGDVNMSAKARRSLVNSFKKREFKYLVNVDTMTTGVDFTHVDVIAILRPTESVGLLQQIIGRGLRLDNNKTDCLILDYAENLDRHCHGGDVFNPKIKAHGKNKGSGGMEVTCPNCRNVNDFTPRKNEEGFQCDKEGYFVDLDGRRILTEYKNFLPSHYGRRCEALVLLRNGKMERCEYRWLGKPCPHCKEDNDVAARYCTKCKGEIVDPNKKLKIEAEKKRRLEEPRTEKIAYWNCRNGISKRGSKFIYVDWITTKGKLRTWLFAGSKEYNKLVLCSKGFEVMPDTITFKRSKSDYFKVIDFNRQMENYD